MPKNPDKKTWGNDREGNQPRPSPGLRENPLPEEEARQFRERMSTAAGSPKKPTPKDLIGDLEDDVRRLGEDKPTDDETDWIATEHYPELPTEPGPIRSTPKVESDVRNLLGKLHNRINDSILDDLKKRSARSIRGVFNGRMPLIVQKILGMPLDAQLVEIIPELIHGKPYFSWSKVHFYPNTRQGAESWRAAWIDLLERVVAMRKLEDEYLTFAFAEPYTMLGGKEFKTGYGRITVPPSALSGPEQIEKNERLVKMLWGGDFFNRYLKAILEIATQWDLTSVLKNTSTPTKGIPFQAMGRKSF
ncbi:hypothetical protein IPJ72_06260 [Candidatus Peregrinibacteria bacterium]|nr:MAG: hypothetical protein IPJ72_06260 [Candidatus Peregrinibacteria bacterium]